MLWKRPFCWRSVQNAEPSEWSFNVEPDTARCRIYIYIYLYIYLLVNILQKIHAPSPFDELYITLPKSTRMYVKYAPIYDGDSAFFLIWWAHPKIVRKLPKTEVTPPRWNCNIMISGHPTLRSFGLSLFWGVISPNSKYLLREIHEQIRHVGPNPTWRFIVQAGCFNCKLLVSGS